MTRKPVLWMAVALAAYTTNTSLSGTSSSLVTARKKFGFTSTSSGIGSKTYNVGAYGSYIGFYNYSTPTISQLLAKAQYMKQYSTFDQNAWNVILSGINQRGDIK